MSLPHTKWALKLGKFCLVDLRHPMMCQQL
jgi:hypothetical protein